MCSGEALAGILRPGDAVANDGAGHIVLLRLALAQLPAAAGRRRLLVRTDSAGASQAFLAGLRTRLLHAAGRLLTHARRLGLAL
jgi:hypothetical protein